MAKTIKTENAEALSEEEQAAMKEYLQEKKAAARRANSAEKTAAEEQETLAKIAAMTGPDRQMAERLHALVKQHAPALTARLWYGMPAYALDGKVICFFQDAAKFKTRYCTLGFSDAAALDEGEMWPSAYALISMGAAEEARVAELLRRAAAGR